MIFEKYKLEKRLLNLVSFKILLLLQINERPWKRKEN